ncbi:MAG: hypothetical protein P4L51_15670 [Puia sp.]|nr:hypothetical protein [Puia sp.]
MSKSLTSGNILCLLAVLGFGLGSCSKEISRRSSGSSSSVSSTSTSSTIAVAVDSTGSDSVYVLQVCARGYFRDSIAASALPASITAFLDSTLSGYTTLQDYEIKDSAGTVGGYVVIVSYNGKPVALLFNASGVLVSVLEQRERGDLNGNGWHEGGRYSNRDGQHRDTVAISALPAAITSYFATGYPGDTLLKAFRNYDSSYLVISKDAGVIYGTVFSSTGSFVRRVVLADPGGVTASVDQTALPSTALSYLTATYPDYVFGKAYSLTSGSTILEYLVVIDANDTKYALLFDGSGAIESTRTIW